MKPITKGLGKVERSILLELSRRAKILARSGVSYMKAIAPRDSGKTINTISMRRKGLVSYRIRVPNIRRGSSTRMDFRLVGWMHTSPRARRHIKTGKPNFVYRTIRILKRLGGRMFRIKLKQ